ncbi:hypothetical protein [Hahella sp. HN01]|uniref:hypothetical protein n=1 Tax=Hahella sp. HN01 TaxID=2847262 RepID=UPI001C1EFEF7|nr:hypothetical protein [Hahella sp. HN01]MBU6955299.1 hypothetical protein [Hahella sp. HN01]
MTVKYSWIENDYNDYDRNNVPESTTEELSDGLIYQLILGLGDGLFLELKIECDCNNDLNVIEKLFKNVGNAVLVSPEKEVTENIWLYENGFSVYKQGSEGYLMVRMSDKKLNPTAGV